LLITEKDEFGFQHIEINVMRDLKIWFKNYLTINTENAFAMTCHSEQMRVPSNEQITFRNTKFTH
jgi:hypothetical protein